MLQSQNLEKTKMTTTLHYSYEMRFWTRTQMKTSQCQMPYVFLQKDNHVSEATILNFNSSS